MALMRVIINKNIIFIIDRKLTSGQVHASNETANIHWHKSYFPWGVYKLMKQKEKRFLASTKKPTETSGSVLILVCLNEPLTLSEKI